MHSFFEEALAWKTQLTWLGVCHNCAREDWSKLCNNTPYNCHSLDVRFSSSKKGSWFWLNKSHYKMMNFVIVEHKTLFFTKFFFLSLWSLFIYCHKVCEFLQTLTSSWLKDSLKQPELPRPEKPKPTWETKGPILPLEILEPCTPKHPHNHKLVCDDLSRLLLS
jgi:hypothetical protein